MVPDSLPKIICGWDRYSSCTSIHSNSSRGRHRSYSRYLSTSSSTALPSLDLNLVTSMSFTNGSYGFDKHNMRHSTLFPVQAEYQRIVNFLPPDDPLTLWLREQCAMTWRHLLFNTTQTFISRLRCPRCNQAPILPFTSYVLDFTQSNHVMPKKMREVWKFLVDDTQKVDACWVNELSLKEVVRRFQEMEMMYWEDSSPGVGCGMLGWNGTRSDDPVS